MLLYMHAFTFVETIYQVISEGFKRFLGLLHLVRWSLQYDLVKV